MEYVVAVHWNSYSMRYIIHKYVPSITDKYVALDVDVVKKELPTNLDP